MARTTPRRWRDIATDLLQRIEAGDLSPGDGSSGRRRLPPEKDLESYYGASRNTVRDALSWLQQQGFVVSEQGKGTFVVHRPNIVHVTLSAAELGLAPGNRSGQWYNRDAFIPASREVTVSPVKVEVQEGTKVIARYLQTNPGSEFVSRHQELFLDERPWALQTSFYPLSFATEGASRLLYPRDIPEGAVAYLGETLGYSEVGFHDEIRARIPDENEKRFFNLGDSAADVVFETVRTAYSPDGKAFRLTVTVWPADRTRLHYNNGKVPDDVLRTPGLGPSDHAPRESPPADDAGSG
ncbi:GntR family transcriptional regulator [Actinomadura livida]|uniref:GntR family transcriptional regulator n=1 Tax=Actinomadura livida TaxID=79909 RepID=A0A7W7IHA3_9ACTN|nr:MULTISPECIES: GntR family transcriptional regulator [Actinomadura]MBB4776965.1 DNA-binding GntR family transcriptional regulator [Actinomadura catellatispora]GGT96058.1 transcriptional regulator [Actinomadura livida]